MEYYFKFSLSDINKIKKGKIDQSLLTKITKMEQDIANQERKEKETIKKNKELWKIAVKEMQKQGFKDNEIIKIKANMQSMTSQKDIFNFLSSGQYKQILKDVKGIIRR